MPRLPRVHVPGGLYYVVHRRNTSRAIFEDTHDYVRFEGIFARALEQFDVRAHAFYWHPNAIYLALQVGTLPLARFMQALGSRYSRYLELPKGTRTPLFQKRYEALLIDERHLLKLVRYIHRLPCSNGSGVPSGNSRWCSDDAYRKRTPLPWLTTLVALQELAHRTESAIARYEAFMREPDPPADVREFSKKPVHDPRIVGDSRFVTTLPRELKIDRGAQTLEDIIQAVMLQQGIKREDLTAKHVRRDGVIARALVTFHAVERDIATYTEVSKALNRAIYALKKAVAHYSNHKDYRHLFVVGALRNAIPIGSDTFINSESKTH